MPEGRGGGALIRGACKRMSRGRPRDSISDVLFTSFSMPQEDDAR